MLFWSPEHHPPEEESSCQTKKKESCEEEKDVKVVVLVEWHLMKKNLLGTARPTQLAELSRSDPNPKLLSHSAYDKFFCDIRDKSAVFNILRQNETIFDIGNG